MTSQQEEGARSGQATPGRVGRYRLCFEVASGGMATVFLARADGPGGFDKLVALKQIHGHLAKDEGFVEMFLDEARLASRIQHPNVCSVIDFGEADGSYYLTMEYLMGEPLGTVMRAARKRAGADALEQPIAPFEAFALRVVADAAEGLHAAHELRDADGEPMNVVHRDVSPANLFVTYDGGVRVVDFGIARAENRVHRTQTGHIKGNFAYMAPEQMAGEEVDRRADVWSLGVILYEMLAGHRLFKRGSLPETVKAVSSGSIPPLSQGAAVIDRDVQQIVERCLSREREQRYATARELSRDISAYLARRGMSVGMADVAEWVNALVPDGEAEKRQLVRLALQDEDGVPRAGRAQDEPSHTTAKSVLVPVIPEDEATMATAPDPHGATVEAQTGRGRARRRGALLLVGGGILAGLWVWGASTSTTSTSTGTGTGTGTSTSASTRTTTSTDTTTRTSTPTGTSTGTTAATGAVAETVTEAEAETVTEAEAETGAEAETVTEAEKVTEAEAETVTEAEAATGAEAVAKAAAKKVRRRSAPSGAPGDLSVATPGGWATLYEGSKKLGTTPGRFTLPSGTHRLKLVPGDGSPPIILRVKITPGGHTRTTHRLK